MKDHTSDRILSLMETITSSYDKLREFESKGCSKDNLENELISIRDTGSEIPSLLAKIYKENPDQFQILINYIPILKMSFLNTIAILIPAIKMQQNPTPDWLKTQASLAIALMRENGTIDILKAVLTFLRG